MKKNILFTIFCVLMALGSYQHSYAQEETPFIAYELPTQNLLKFNRYLLNPTFSTVREDKSYINLYHRNQSVAFDNNNRTYFLSYSGRIGDRSGVGVSLYTQREGLIDNYGVLANYAYGIKLSDKSNFTFGGNFSYYSSGFNENRASALDPDDPLLQSLDNTSLITFQPGFNLSLGQFDLGAISENFFDYNLKTNEQVTDFGEKTYTGHLQYTHEFKKTAGLLEGGRLMPLARVRSIAGDDISFSGSLILDLPKIGWLQAGYDDFYGAAAGIGFNLNKRISVGYTVEKGLSNNFDDFGLTHEISLAYSFTPNLTEDRVMLEDEEDYLVENEEEEVPEEELSVAEKDLKIAELEKKLAENSALLDELMLRQDSIEKNQQRDLERRFELVMRMMKNNNDIANSGMTEEEVERKAKEIFYDTNGSGSNDYASTDGTNGGDNHDDEMDYEDDLGQTDYNENNDGYVETGGTNGHGNHDNDDPFYTDKKTITHSDNNSGYTDRGEDALEESNSRKDNTNFYPYQRKRGVPIPNVSSGHYLIANVYRGTSHMNKFIDDLAAQGISANYFTNPSNGLNYVYLEGYNTRSEAVEAYKNGFDGRYSGETWVMNVEGDTGTGLLANNENNNDSPSGSDDLRQNVVGNGRHEKVDTNSYPIAGDRSFYIIANVFAVPRNANRFVKTLNSQGLSASYFINPANNYRYVYIKKHHTWNNALESYYSKINDQYHEEMWIMRYGNKI